MECGELAIGTVEFKRRHPSPECMCYHTQYYGVIRFLATDHHLKRLAGDPGADPHSESRTE
jgi:hypothetical protein